jgi:hypothetical protein
MPIFLYFRVILINFTNVIAEEEYIRILLTIRIMGVIEASTRQLFAGPSSRVAFPSLVEAILGLMMVASPSLKVASPSLMVASPSFIVASPSFMVVKVLQALIAKARGS